MLELLRRYLSFTWRKSRFWFCVQVAIVLAALVFTLYFFIIKHQTLELGTNLFASFIGFLVGAFLVAALLNKLGVHEDERKVCFDDEVLKKQYKNNYWHEFSIHPEGDLDIKQRVDEDVKDEKGSLFNKVHHSVLRFFSYLRQQRSKVDTDRARVYAERLIQGSDEWELKDSPQKQFEVDSFIMNQYSSIMAAHGRSKHKAALTIRLQDCRQDSDGKYHLETMRSTYIAHLLTNRAIDYKIDGQFSLREVYENRDKLVPLNRSKMSNHIGINALVFLSEEGTGKKEDRKYLLLGERDKSGTIAKDKLTASVAIRLDMENIEGELTKEYLLKNAVLNYMPQSLGVSSDWLNEVKPDIKFLGASRDIYEGGKPTFFYEVDLQANAKQFMKARYENKQAAKETEVDKTEHVHVVLWKTLRMNPHDNKKQRTSDKLSYSTLRHFKYKIKTREYCRGCEKNLLAAFWFLGGCGEK